MQSKPESDIVTSDIIPSPIFTIVGFVFKSALPGGGYEIVTV